MDTDPSGFVRPLLMINKNTQNAYLISLAIFSSAHKQKTHPDIFNDNMVLSFLQ